MRITNDILTADDRALLQEMARRLEAHTSEIAAEWAAAWEQAQPPRDIDPGAYHQALHYMIEYSVRRVLQFVLAGDFEGLYQFQFDNNRDGARRQLVRGALPVFGQPELHLAARVGDPVMCRWIERAFADDPVRGLRAQLAQERLGGQLTMLLGEAYSLEREHHLKKLSEKLRRALEVSERLRAVGHAIVQSLDVEPVIDLTLRTAVQLLEADGAGLTLANREGTALQLRGLVGGDPADLNRMVAIDDSLNGWVYRNNHPARSPRDWSKLTDRIREAVHARGIEDFAMVPLRAAGKPIGALGVNRRRAKRFSDDDVHVLQSLADSVAIAIENARVYGEVQDALRAAERANHARSEFVAAVSHEIRSPLSAVSGYVQYLQDGAFGPLSDEQAETVQRLEMIVQRTLRLTTDLVEHARIEAGRLPLNVCAVEVEPLLDELCESARVFLKDRRVAFRAEAQTGAESVLADADRLRQILTNLLTNAVKFTDHGEITLIARPAEHRAAVEFVFRDTGVGIHPRDLPRIFDLFYCTEASTRVGGSGIGLYLSRQLATLMNGQLVAESEVGRGSVFTLTLPVAAAGQRS